MVSSSVGRLDRCRPVRECVAEVLLLQHLAELRRAPVGNEELQPRAGAKPPIAVVAEDADDADPRLAHLIRSDEDAEPLRHHRVRRKTATDPQVEARRAIGTDHADERHVVDLVDRAQRSTAGDRGLELARQVRERRVADIERVDLTNVRRRVGDLLRVDPCHRAAENVAWRVAARLESAQTHRLELVPNGGNIFDADPVQLDVLPVGDVSEIATVGGGDVPDGAQLFDAQLPTRNPDPHHEVPVVELLRLEQPGLPTADPRPTLGIEAHPAHPAAQIGSIDRVEPRLGVDVEDATLDVQRIVVLLHPLVGVEWLSHAERPLTLAARLALLSVRSTSPGDAGKTSGRWLGARGRGGRCRHARGPSDQQAQSSRVRTQGSRATAPGRGRRIRQPADRPRSTRAASRRAGAQRA